MVRAHPVPWARTILLVLAVPTAGVLPVFLLGGLAVQVQADLGFGEAGLGATFAVFFGTAALASAAAGRLVHRIGSARAMRIGAVAAVASLLGIGTLARSLPAMLPLLVVGGVANAICQPGTNDLIAREVPLDRQGFAFAAKQSAIPLSTLLGGLAVPLLGLTVGWRWAFVGGAGLAVLAALLVPRGGAGGSRAAERPAAGSLPVRALVLLAVAGGLGAASANMVGSFLVLSAVDIGLGEGAAGLLLAASSVLVIAVRLTLGVVADRRGTRFFEMVALLLAGGSVGYLLLASGRTGLFLVGAFVASGAGWGWAGLFNLAVVDHDRSVAAIATGITQTGVFVGAVVGPVSFGAVAEASSFGAGWLLACAVSAAAACAMMLGWRRLRRVPVGGGP